MSNQSRGQTDRATIVFDPTYNRWLQFNTPLQVLSASSTNETVALLNKVEQIIENDQLWAVGWLTYEASAAFDAALITYPTSDLPLAWFGIYDPPEPLTRLPPATALEPINWKPSITESDYLQAAARVRELIARGDTYQVNLSFRLNGEAPSDPYQLFYSMHQAQAGAYSSYIDAGRFAICCASPELFFERQGDTIVCRPMKGTAARGCTPSLDQEARAKLVSCPKNRAENVMIVDMVRNDLSLIAKTGTVKVNSLYNIESYPHLLQMTSQVTAKTDRSTTEVIAALFPSASITGAPKPSTTRIIADLETTPRGIYTGSIGVLAPNKRHWFNVAIRTAVVDRFKATTEYGVGSGIVWNSEPSSEFKECLIKASAITRCRPEFELFETMLWTPQDGISLLQLHLKRLHQSASYYGWKHDSELIELTLYKTTNQLKKKNLPHRVRLTLNSHGQVNCQVSELTPLPSPYKIALAKHPISSSDHRLYHKTSDRSPYDQAIPSNQEANDVILWNERGEITETRIANIIVEIDGGLFTPPISSGLLGGCQRAILIEKGEIRERVIHLTELSDQTKILLANSLRGVWGCELLNSNYVSG
jgi:para-aminobenzoate synthetase/4-amino-4-deoxychorismate lyase